MRITMLGLFFCICSYCSFSQIGVAYSRTPGMLGASSLKPVAGGTWIGLHWLDKKGKGTKWANYTTTVTFQQYDANFKLLKQVDFPAGAGKISNAYSRLQQLGNKYYFIYMQPQEGTKLGDLKAMEVNPATMEFGEPKVLVSSQEFDFTLPDFRYMTYFKVFYKASPSARSALFLFKYRDNFLVCCTDEDLVPRWKKRESKTIDAPSIRSAEVDDAGNVYIGYSEKQTGYLKYSTNGTSGDHPVTLPEGSASIILFLATRDTVFAAGTYGNSDYSKGVYKGIINKKGELASLQSAPFPNTFLEPLDKEGWASTKAKKFGIVNLFSGELQLSGDGALVMLAEFSKETGTPGAGYMHVGSVMHICFGKPAVSFARAPKYSVGGGLMGYTEHSIGSDYHFYYAFTTPSETVIIYGDNPDNLSHDIDLDAKVWTPNKEIYVAARIDKNGNVRREKVVPQPIPYHQTVGPAMITLPVFIDRLDQLVILQK